MRHIVSILIQNEAGALSRAANLFSSRGYNIESLNVAPTANDAISRITLVTSGADEVIDQIIKQVHKLVDVVDITDMTSTDHIERELGLFKLHLSRDKADELQQTIDSFGARILDDRDDHYTIELIGGSQEIDRFVDSAKKMGELSTVVRSGAMAVARGAPVFGSR